VALALALAFAPAVALVKHGQQLRGHTSNDCIQNDIAP
jgi:hypothetical protein